MPLPFSVPKGGLPGWSPADLTVPAPRGGLAFFAACRPCQSGTRRGAVPCLACFSCHIIDFLPPSPRPPSPPGKGGFLVFLCKGLRPLHPRDLHPRGTGSAGVSGACGGAQGDGCLLTLPPCPRRGACPVGRLLTLPSRQPQGGLPSLPPANPAFSLLSFPHPPAPLPLRGRGRFLVHFAGGSAPGTPVLNRLRHLQLLPPMSPAGVCLRNLQLGAKPTEPPFYWQCR